MLRAIRRSLITQAKRTGLLSLVARSRWRQSRLLILCYHGLSIADEDAWDPELFMPREMFHQRLELLERGNYSVLPLAEALVQLGSGELPPRSVAITVDDGLFNFCSVMLPILEKAGYPATVYLRTDHVLCQLPVFRPLVRYMLWKAGQPSFDGALVGAPGQVDVRTAEARVGAFRLIDRYVESSNLGPTAQDQLAAQLAKELHVDYERIVGLRLFHLMSADEARQLPPDLVSIQLHTHTHHAPTIREQFVMEIRENRRCIAALTGRTPVHFCYPSGAYDLRFLPWLADLGIESATIGERGFATQASEPLLLPRFVDTSLVRSTDFEGWIAGLSAWLPRRRTGHG